MGRLNARQIQWTPALTVIVCEYSTSDRRFVRIFAVFSISRTSRWIGRDGIALMYGTLLIVNPFDRRRRATLDAGERSTPMPSFDDDRFRIDEPPDRGGVRGDCDESDRLAIGFAVVSPDDVFT
jgi:hypothetical protein